jgi:hypothetical protein
MCNGVVCGVVSRWCDPVEAPKSHFPNRKRTTCSKCKKLVPVADIRYQLQRVDWRNQADMSAWCGPIRRTVCWQCAYKEEQAEWDAWYRLQGLNPPSKDIPYPHDDSDSAPPKEPQ